MEKELYIKLDKFYTKEEIAEQCYFEFKKFVQSFLTKEEMSNVCYIEPSAGSGIFLKCIQEDKIGFDIEPTDNGQYKIQKIDFLKEDISKLFVDKKKKYLIIGNPPFGKKSKLAIDFINKAFEYSDIVGFILPIQFYKWSAQSKIHKEAKLIYSQDLPENSFKLLNKDYKIRCCFQIWTTKQINHLNIKNQRIIDKPQTEHKDFHMYQYNRTEIAKKYFDYDWDFAVPRQGYLDYSFKAYHKKDCNQKYQWIFFKAKNQEALKRLLQIDFVKLSKKNIGLPGFGKADVVAEYNHKK
jgi:hypothetical protein